MKKRVLTIMLMMLMMLSVLTVSAMAAEEVTSGTCGALFYHDKVVWSFDETSGTLTISGKGPMMAYEKVNNKAPWSHLRDRIQHVVVETGVTSIGGYAFYSLEQVQTVTLGEDVKSIGEYAFTYCYALTDFTAGEGLERIETHAFYLCGNLKHVRLPDSVTEIGFNTFADCEKMMLQSFPAQLKVIGDSAFNGCDALTDFVLPEGLEVIGRQAFDGCEGMERVYIPNSVKEIGFGAFRSTNLTEVVIPPVERLGESAFASCYQLRKVVISKGTKYIDTGAFSDCGRLTEVHIPNTVRYIGDGAFYCHTIALVNPLDNVYYGGTQNLWQSIAIEPNNERLRKAALHCVQGCDHVPEIVPAVEPTCTENGLTEGVICGQCGEVLTAQTVVPLTGHDYDKTKRKCLVCGTSNPFADVDRNAWYFAPVLWALRSDVTGGTGPLRFSPDADCTRAQVVTFLWAANGRPEPASMDNPFEDVADDAWYLKPVLWAVEKGITTGISPNSFGPDKSCTRAQIVTFLYAAAGKPEVKSETNVFTDVADTDWFVDPVMWAKENDVTGGISADRFGPGNTCTRGQVVTFLYKVYADK